MRAPLLFRASWAFGFFACAFVKAFAAAGGVDPAFQTPPIGFGISRVAVQADGKILFGGGLKVTAQPEPLGLVRLNTDGTKDATFDIGKGFLGQALVIPGVFTNIGQPVLNVILPTAAGIVVGGTFDSVNGQPRTNLVRLLATGAVDPSFATHADGVITTVVPMAGGKLLVGGAFKNIKGAARNGLARLNADGSVDTFNPNWGTLLPSVQAIWPQADGKLVLAGGFTVFAGGALSPKLVARLNADGTVDGTFTPPAAEFLTDRTTGLLVQADGKIIVTGLFKQIAGNARRSIARLNADGTFDAAWPGPGVGNLGLEGVNAIAAAAGGQFYIGGKFETYNGQGPSGIARLNADGTRDATFQKPAGSSTFWVDTLAVQADGKVLAGGTFTLGTQTQLLLRLLDKDAGPPPPPTITRQPASLSANLGATGQSFTVEASGAPPLSYRWQFKGADLPFKTEPTLAFLSALKESDAGDYRVIVSNAGGAVTSSVATLTVILPARIAQHPVGKTVTVGEPVTFAVTAGGTPPFTYQWRKGAQDLPGATAATFSIATTQLADAGSYTVVVGNAAGSETSQAAVLAVNLAKPVLTLQPLSQTVTLPDTNLTAAALAGRRLCLTIAGALPPWIPPQGSYCITFTGANYASPAGGALTGASAGTFTVHPGTAPPATLIDFAGFFPDGQTATLTLLANGIYEFNRANLVADQNGTWQLTPPFVPPALPSVTFTAAATGTGPLSYQWRRNGADIPNATGATLTLDNVTTAAAGDYTVVVTNAGGSTTSAVAKLTINAAAPTELKLGEVTLAPRGLLSFTLATQAGVTYVLEQQAVLNGGNWTTVQTFTGDGSVKKLEAALAGVTGFFRVRVQ